MAVGARPREHGSGSTAWPLEVTAGTHCQQRSRPMSAAVGVGWGILGCCVFYALRSCLADAHLLRRWAAVKRSAGVWLRGWGQQRRLVGARCVAAEVDRALGHASAGGCRRWSRKLEHEYAPPPKVAVQVRALRSLQTHGRFESVK